MVKTRLLPMLAIVVFVVAAAVSAAWIERYFLLLSMVLAALAVLPFFLRYERKQLQAREAVMIAMLIALAAVSRVPFTAIPSVQPTTFVIIVSALVFGAESGFIIGALAALVSNLFLGQGPWTPWQMLGWGMVGYTAGLFRHSKWMRTLGGKIVFGFVWGFLFGWLMNLSYTFAAFSSFSWRQFLVVYTASAYFDLLHALSNAVLLALFGASWIKILTRFKRKFGLL